MSTQTIDLLLRRRSVVANNLTEPGPSQDEIQKILQIGARVPDHKQLAPWRFILFAGDAREKFGDVLCAACEKEEGPISDVRRETERQRFMRAPLVIAVVSHIKTTKPVPEWEQILSAGAVCQNIVIAANAFGFSAQWLTEWYAYNQDVLQALKLSENERIAGYIYIGSALEAPKERPRPELQEIASSWG